MSDDNSKLAELISENPVHFYSEDELDAIDELDSDLAYRLSRAQILAERAQPEGFDENAEIDEEEVKAAIEEARHILAQDGGDIEFVSIEAHTVRIELKGACVGCPKAPLDLKNVVERLVRSRVPGVKEVVNRF